MGEVPVFFGSVSAALVGGLLLGCVGGAWASRQAARRRGRPRDRKSPPAARVSCGDALSRMLSRALGRPQPTALDRARFAAAEALEQLSAERASSAVHARVLSSEVRTCERDAMIAAIALREATDAGRAKPAVARDANAALLYDLHALQGSAPRRRGRPARPPSTRSDAHHAPSPQRPPRSPPPPHEQPSPGSESEAHASRLLQQLGLLLALPRGSGASHAGPNDASASGAQLLSDGTTSGRSSVPDAPIDQKLEQLAQRARRRAEGDEGENERRRPRPDLPRARPGHNEQPDHTLLDA